MSQITDNTKNRGHYLTNQYFLGKICYYTGKTLQLVDQKFFFIKTCFDAFD